MEGFIDIHTHILPGVDDGAQDMTEAMRLLRMAWENGTRKIFLTPHYRGKYKKNKPEELKENCIWLREMMLEELPDMEVYLGNEVAYEIEAPEAIHSGRALCLNQSQYVLLEFQTTALRAHLISGVSETVRFGYIPIIAHVERYDVSRKDPKIIGELLEMGALLQLNADSVMGWNGLAIKRCCHKLLKAGQVHFVASDAHNQKYRPPLLRECFLRIYKKYGREYAFALFCENAQAVIENRSIH